MRKKNKTKNKKIKNQWYTLNPPRSSREGALAKFPCKYIRPEYRYRRELRAHSSEEGSTRLCRRDRESRLYTEARLVNCAYNL